MPVSRVRYCVDSATGTACSCCRGCHARRTICRRFYNDVRVSAVLQVIGLSFIVRGFENIGIIEFQRNLRFDMEFKFRVTVKLLSTVATIVLAFWLRNYWALAIGSLIRSIIGVVCSYLMSAYRPRWTLAGWDKTGDSRNGS